MLFIFIFLYLHPVYNAKHHIWAHQILENPLKDLKKKIPLNLGNQNSNLCINILLLRL